VTSKLQLFRKIFLVVFIVASLLIFGLEILLVSALQTYYLLFQEIIMQIPGYHELIPSSELGFIVPIYVSISTALIALLGFIVTTVLSFRREKRDSLASDLALKQKEIELECARLELEQLKQKLSVKTKSKMNRGKKKSK
jgi:hypothetical protein